MAAPSEFMFYIPSEAESRLRIMENAGNEVPVHGNVVQANLEMADYLRVDLGSGAHPGKLLNVGVERETIDNLPGVSGRGHQLTVTRLAASRRTQNTFLARGISMESEVDCSSGRGS